MSRLVAVSNRVGRVRGTTPPGGLAVALLDALRRANGLWFGWSGNVSADAGNSAPTIESGSGITSATLDLSPRELDQFYNGFANRCLWPVFHFRFDLTRFTRPDFKSYLTVNERFADQLIPLLRDDDLIWVHDFHLIHFGEMLRRKKVEQPLGFFLHIPFPPPEILTTLPVHAELVKALFAYDLIGFQTPWDRSRFMGYVLREAGGRVEGDIFHAFGRKVRVGVFPIGIDVDEFATVAASAHGEVGFRRMKEAKGKLNQIIGVDRLDYTKGLPQKLLAYESFLTAHPDRRRNIRMLQVAPVSRADVSTYKRLRRSVDEICGRINGRFSDPDWTPVVWLSRSFTRRALAGWYRASEIGLITPLRDGMNLTAQEYVAAQDPDDPGVLILSCFAGSAANMTAALLINPFEPAGIGDAINTALEMSREERSERHADLMQTLKENDVSHWRESFIATLRQAAE